MGEVIGKAFLSTRHRLARGARGMGAVKKIHYLIPPFEFGTAGPIAVACVFKYPQSFGLRKGLI